MEEHAVQVCPFGRHLSLPCAACEAFHQRVLRVHDEWLQTHPGGCRLPPGNPHEVYQGEEAYKKRLTEGRTP